MANAALLPLSDDALSYTYWNHGLEAFVRRLARFIDNPRITTPTSCPDRVRRCRHDCCIQPADFDQNDEAVIILTITFDSAAIYLRRSSAVHLAVMTFHGDRQVRSQANALPNEVVDYALELVRLTTPDPEPKEGAIAA